MDERMKYQRQIKALEISLEFWEERLANIGSDYLISGLTVKTFKIAKQYLSLCPCCQYTFGNEFPYGANWEDIMQCCKEKCPMLWPWNDVSEEIMAELFDCGNYCHPFYHHTKTSAMLGKTYIEKVVQVLKDSITIKRWCLKRLDENVG